MAFPMVCKCLVSMTLASAPVPILKLMNSSFVLTVIFHSSVVWHIFWFVSSMLPRIDAFIAVPGVVPSSVSLTARY